MYYRRESQYDHWHTLAGRNYDASPSRCGVVYLTPRGKTRWADVMRPS